MCQSLSPVDLPQLWLLTDRRNDRDLEAALERLPHGSALVFRHYHLDLVERRARFDTLLPVMRARAIVPLLAGPHGEGQAQLWAQAKAWGASGIYGPPEARASQAEGLYVVTAHNAEEMAKANQCKADAVMLSPVFATRSHPGAEPLGQKRFHALAEQAQMPVIALGGMTAERAQQLGCKRWAAIDGLS